MLINFSLGFTSYAISTILFSLILIISFFSLYKLKRGKYFLLLVSSTLAWSFILTLSQIGHSISFEIVFVAEALRYFSWFYILQQVSGHYLDHPYRFNKLNLLSPLLVITFLVIALISSFFNAQISAIFHLSNSNTIQVIWMIAFAIFGLTLVEHLIRNTTYEQRDSILYLAITGGAIFTYDLFVFSDALLVNKIDYEYWSARGIINVLITPTLIIAAVRNPTLAPRLHISRQFVFHSATLIGSGFYLILMSLAGYIIKQESGEWGELLQALFLFITILLLITLFFSNTLKIKLKRFVGRSFRNKYDYRTEWNRFSNTLLSSNTEYSIFKRSIIAVAQIVDSQGGTLWLKDNNQYRCYAGWMIDSEHFLPVQQNSPLIQFTLNKKTFFTLSEYQKESHTADEINWFCSATNSWLILPLWDGNNLFGFIQLNKSDVQGDLDIEDYDLLETIGHHISLSLSLNESISALQHAERFQQMNQMTTFLVHDLKTLLSQLSLLVDNGKIHKDNPEFIDDMLNTVGHVTQKMQRLIHQLKEPKKSTGNSLCNIAEVINSIVKEFHLSTIQINVINNLSEDVLINCSEEELGSSFKHIIQNAVDSMAKHGNIDIILGSDQIGITSISIQDNGAGMSRDFINNRLFKPFDSTKGVSGMGIGVYQSREYIRSLKGNIQVSSKENSGTTFTITLPTSTKNV